MQFQNKIQAIQWAQKENQTIFFWGNRVIVPKNFENQHPGGKAILRKYHQEDISAIFEDPSIHQHHILSKHIAFGMTVGYLKDHPDKGFQNRPYLNDKTPLLDQVKKLNHQQYMHLIETPVFLQGSPRLFHSNFFQYFSHNQYHNILIAHLPLVILPLYMGRDVFQQLGIIQTIGYWMFSFFILWMTIQYFLHRLVFHFQNILPDSYYLRIFHFCLHGIHHTLPLDMDRIVFPPAMGLTIMSILIFILFQVVPSNLSYIILSGFQTGYILYEMFHYFMHRADYDILRNKFRKHNIHHFKGISCNYGVTNSIYDKIFGTYIGQ